MSEQEKFTPGPWEVAGFDSRFTDERYFGITTPKGQMTVESYGECERDREFNAPLMSAAPDMYRDLKAAVIQMCFHCPSGEASLGEECTSNSNCFVKQWRETLKKARGEQ